MPQVKDPAPAPAPAAPAAPGLFTAALRLATERHAGQTRKDGRTPFIQHPSRVAALVRQQGVGDETVLAAAVLHDVVEDTAPTRAEAEALQADLEHRFGPEVAGLVDELTKAPPGLESRRQYTESFQRKAAAACLVKLADRLDNLRDWSGMEAGFRATYLAETVDLVGAVDANPRVPGSPYAAACDALSRELLAVCHGEGVTRGRHARWHPRPPSGERGLPARTA